MGWKRREFTAWLKNAVGDLPEAKPVEPAPPEPVKPAISKALQEFSSNSDDTLMSIADVCLVAGLSRATVNRRISDSVLKKVGTGGKSVRITVNSVRKMLS